MSYHDVAVGKKLVSQFRDENGNDLYASEELDLDLFIALNTHDALYIKDLELGTAYLNKLAEMN